MAGHDRFRGDFLLGNALAGGATVAEAAQQAGMSERTAYRWLNKPEFRRRVARIQQTMARRAVARGPMRDPGGFQTQRDDVFELIGGEMRLVERQ